MDWQKMAPGIVRLKVINKDTNQEIDIRGVHAINDFFANINPDIDRDGWGDGLEINAEVVVYFEDARSIFWLCHDYKYFLAEGDWSAMHEVSHSLRNKLQAQLEYPESMM